ncbi:MAG: nitric-oxide reductase large subunit, partial [Candidatus Eisenbacteria bacterium]|nr:nitric-oxide reductase large subunit [Candidatus Eisenbacteria bacterium]
MGGHRRLWWVLGGTLAAAFTILGFFGREVYRQAPPIPERVVSVSGRVLMTKAQILDGQQVWQSTGGQQQGSIWGHGAYQAPDWSADWLHREATALLDIWSLAESGLRYDQRPLEAQAALRARLQAELRANRYDPDSGTITVSAERAQAMAQTAAHYRALFGGDPSLSELREDYAMQDAAVADPAR